MKEMFGVINKSLMLFQKSGKPLLLLSTARWQSTASTEAPPERLSKNLSFRPAYDSHIDQECRPLVLLYGWLVAKSRHIHKYGDFYMKKGFDVLHIKVDPMQLMFPLNAQTVVQQVVDFTQEVQRRAQPVLVHGFSVGGYLYGETLVKMLSDPIIAENMMLRLKGQVMDSPVDHDRIPKGISQAVTNVPILQKSLRATISAYLTLSRSHTMKHYTRSSETFKENPFQSPTLFLYSDTDPIGAADKIEEVAEKFEDTNIDVHLKKFEGSAHVSHFHLYPVEYITALNDFLQHIGLVKEFAQPKIKVLA